ncbi:5-guanidino-2-oxopentanoate decarboxylase [Arvimicrobium flavum]|uniref:5-guanidino-2-oxopentanoate decarboxylase n=1 Tax=Arvimicrobium flavum TaxID=3393320 RepID=UPI00237B26CD|nr:5-guanidino-2-oxopentanoate decarboxylase [Mesorhizobium shangrilense]
MTTVGESLVRLLEANGVEIVFGIPGVHTVELYRGLAGSSIRHITPRHEQGAGFMADGYARVSGKPGVAFVITGPGLTNTITAMAQARADSVPMLVISGVNALASLGKGLGFLHELPDQRGMMQKVALTSTRIERPEQLAPAIDEAFARLAVGRPGPVHIEVPLDVMRLPSAAPQEPRAWTDDLRMMEQPILDAARLAAAAERPLILAGGGARRAEAELGELAELLHAPVVTTINARGLLHRHPLGVPASPSLPAVRKLMADSDLVIAVGTEFGPTDYDIYANGGFVLPPKLVRIDIDDGQLRRRPATVAIEADAARALRRVVQSMRESVRRNSVKRADGAARADEARRGARAELEPGMDVQLEAVEMIRDALPGAIIVGDSTQPVYAANMFYDHDRPGGWFNAATGYGALGYGAPAAIGAALAAPDAPVVCLTGDGGFQFTLPELGAARDARTPVIFVVWNNRGYREIELSMRSASVEPVGVSPAPPDFCAVAAAYGLPAERVKSLADLPAALRSAREANQPFVIEIEVP